MISSSNFHFERIEIKWNDAETKENSWNITWFFMEGDLMKVEITPALDWSDPPLEPADSVPFPSKGVFVNITDPLGKMTEFFCVFVKPDSSSLMLYLMDISVDESHGLLVGANASLEKKHGIAGQAMTTGNYTAWTWAVLPGALPGSSYSPPAAMAFLKGEKIAHTEYPYSDLIYIGTAAIILGAVLMVYGFKKRRKGYRYEKGKQKRAKLQ